MKFFIFALVAIILWQIKKVMFAKIDRNEEKTAKTPSEATYIREHFPKVVQYILSIPSYQVLFERSDMIKMGKSDSKEYYTISHYSGGLLIALVRNSSVAKEWHFPHGEDENHIIYKLKSSF